MASTTATVVFGGGLISPISGTASGKTLTFSSVPFGSETENRMIIILFSSDTNDSNESMSYSIGGQPSKTTHYNIGGPNSNRSYLVFQKVPTGTSGTVTVTFNTQFPDAGSILSVWAVSGVEDAVETTGFQFVGVFPTTLAAENLSTTAGGSLLGVADTNSSSANWTGGIIDTFTEGPYVAGGKNLWHHTGVRNNLSTGTVSVKPPGSFADFPSIVISIAPPAKRTLNPTKYSDPDIFLTSSIFGSIIAVLFSNENIFNTDVITTSYSMSQSIFVDVDTFETIRAFAKVVPGLFTEVNSFISPTVSPGIFTIHPVIYSDVDIFGLDAVSIKLFEILFSNSNSFQTPRILPSTAIIHPSLLQDVNSFFQFLISMGIDPTEFINQSTFFPSTSTFYPPLATPFKLRQLQNKYKLPVLRTYRR